MDALELLMRPLVTAINRQLAAKTLARELQAELDGRVFALRVGDTALAVFFRVAAQGLMLSTHYAGEPDVVVSGSLLSLARLAGPNGEQLIRDGSVEITGDALLAKQFQRLLHLGRPDPEEELSRLIGDVAAHGVGEALRSVGGWTRETRAIMRQNVAEYLQEESRSLPTRYEFEAFSDGVNVLRDDVARFEARLARLQQGRS